MMQSLQSIPKTDPAGLLRLRDGIYSPDLLIAAVGWLDFFTWLDEHPSSNSATICSSLKIDQRPTDVMLTLFTSMDLITNIAGNYHLTDYAKEYLTEGSPWNLGPYLETMKERPICIEMRNILKSGKPASWGSKKNEKEWAIAMERKDVAEKFTAAMDSRGAYLAPAMARTIDCKEYKTLLDIAGGSGIYACAVVAHNEHIRAAVFEKAPVDKAAQFSIKKKGMSDKVSVVAGDMFEELPSGYDIHLISHALHDWGEVAVTTLLKNSFQALPPGGMIVIHDAHLNEDKTGPLPVAEFSVLLMYATEGKCYSVSEITTMLKRIGFIDTTFTPTTASRSIITAKKPVKITTR